MTLRLNIKLKMTCPKHPKYDPEKHGEAAIKAGCAHCYRMLDVFRRAASFRDTSTKLADELSSAAFLGDGA